MFSSLAGGDSSYKHVDAKRRRVWWLTSLFALRKARMYYGTLLEPQIYYGFARNRWLPMGQRG